MSPGNENFYLPLPVDNTQQNNLQRTKFIQETYSPCLLALPSAVFAPRLGHTMNKLSLFILSFLNARILFKNHIAYTD